MKTTIAFLLILAFHTYPPPRVSAQAPSATGRWQIEFTFGDTSHHTLRFDAEDSGKGTYLLLDRISSLVEPAETFKAEWNQPAGTNAVTLTGLIEFPIGNVGRDPGTLVFTGTFDSTDSITGEVAFFRDPKDPTPAKSGTFKAVRVTDQSKPRVELVSPNSGGNLKRGTEVEIEWQAESGFPIRVQQIFLSVDKGKNFVEITPLLGGATTHVTWMVPDALPKVKKALLKVVVVNAAGDSAEGRSNQPFKIK